MRGYLPPRALVTGTCFVCLKPCDKDAYCHLECAYAMSEEKTKRIKEAIEKAKEVKN